MRRIYWKDKVVGLRGWGRVIPLLLLPLLLSIYTFTAAAAQEVVTVAGAKLKVQEAYLKGQMDSSLRPFEMRRGDTAGIRPEIRGRGLSPSQLMGTVPLENARFKSPQPPFSKGGNSISHLKKLDTGGFLLSYEGQRLMTGMAVNKVILAGSGSISGRVTDPNGAGIQYVSVYVMNANWNVVSYASTDADGNYTATSIPTGAYKVQFNGRNLGYVNEYYNDKSNNGNADTISVTAPATTTGIDAVLDVGGSISGRVTNTTGAGIQGVWVEVHVTNWGWFAWAFTDADGNYTVIGIPAGAHKVQFNGSDSGYISEWYNDKSNYWDADTVPVTASLTTAGIDAVLEPGGSISGRVTDSTGAGIQNLYVSVSGIDQWWINFGVSTDSNGNYTVTGIPTGAYRIKFDGRNLGYVTEWYNDKLSDGTADPVPVTAPLTTSGIDAVLEAGGTISGRVTDSIGAGIQNVWVGVYDANGGWISVASTDANGDYTAIAIPTGAYKVFFYGRESGYLDEWYNNTYNACNADLITVTAPNSITGIDAVLEAGGSISGRVTDSTGTGIPNVWIDIVNTNDEWISYASTDADGNYTVVAIPTGSYKVSFYGSDLGYVHEWYNNTPDIGNADLVSVTAPNATSGIDAILEVGGRISGKVTDSTGTGIQNVYVDIFNSNGDWLSWALTDAAGIYMASGVPTGAHKVRFYGSHMGYLSEWYNDKPDFGNADTVSVTTPGTTTGIDAVLAFGSSGSISGRVTDSTGAGIQDVWVKVYDVNLGYWILWVRPDASGNYMADGLPTGQYKVQFSYDGCSGYLSEWYNNKPDSVSADTVAVTAPNATVGIDAVLSVKTVFEEDDPAITCAGVWKTYTCPQCSGGSIKYSKQTTDKCEFSFNGTGIKWLVTKGPMMGKARVYLDGVNKGLVDLYSATTKFKQTLQANGFSPGSHTIAIEVSGQKNTNASDRIVNVDAFEVVP